MRFVFAGLLVLSGAMLIGFAYHDTVGLAWTTITE